MVAGDFQEIIFVCFYESLRDSPLETQDQKVKWLDVCSNDTFDSEVLKVQISLKPGDTCLPDERCLSKYLASRTWCRFSLDSPNF